ncbi:leucine-rich repeat-containing protein 26 [Gastrophryne carolinensis]
MEQVKVGTGLINYSAVELWLWFQEKVPLQVKMMKSRADFSLIVLLVGLHYLHPHACPDICSCSSGTINCYNRGLYFIPEDIDTDTHTMLLAYNKITSLKTFSFYKYPNLRHLELHNNMLSTIDPKAFQNLQNLSYLDLSSNHLTIIESEAFQPLSNLTMLNLGNNRISRLPGNILEPLVELQKLYLHNNALTALQVDFLYKLPALVELRLDGNSWTCTCQIRSLLFWMKDNSEKIYEKQRTLCGIPSSLSQYPLLELSSDSFKHCQGFFTLLEYLYFLLIGIVLFACSILLCLLAGMLIVTYNRLLLRAHRRAHEYKKKPPRKEEGVINGSYIPDYRI